LMENCDCECKGIEKYTPIRIYNPAGLSSISYRVGSHGRFKAQMVSEISSKPALSRLTTRSDNDLSIALLDSWATIADVLTFYQERIANEGFLTTATERRSVLELARSIGYELRPGVAAGTYLAFKMDESKGSPEKITIQAGLKVQSIPGKDETSQVFETSEDIEARQEWNQIKPRQLQKQDAAMALRRGQAIFKGTATKLRPGDGLLFIVGGRPIIGGRPKAFRIAKEVEIDAEKQLTKVAFDAMSDVENGDPKPPIDFIGKGAVIDSGSNFTSDDLKEILAKKTWTESELEAKAQLEGWSLDVIIDAINSLVGKEEETANGVYVLRIKSGVFGQTAPAWSSLPPEMRYPYKFPRPAASSGVVGGPGGVVGTTNPPDPIPPPYPLDWDTNGTPVNKNSRGIFYDEVNHNLIYLDNTYPSIQPESWVVLKQESLQSSAFKISATKEDSLTEFALSGKATGLILDKAFKWVDTESGVEGTIETTEQLSNFKFRKTTVYSQPEKLILADVPVDHHELAPGQEPGQEIVLEKMVGWMHEGQSLMIEGELASQPGITKREIASIDTIVHNLETDLLTTIKLPSLSPLKYAYKLDTVTINANVAKATHGETKEEAIGSGDPAQRFQSFELKQNPLTFVPDSSPSGAKSTLEVRIDKVKWWEAASFEDLSESDMAYITRTSNDAKTSIILGDGLNGRLPPTSTENIRAKYRVGIGTNGLLDADKLTLLMKRPLGIKSVTNPIATTGAADPEELGEARKNAPRTALTLDRIVSLKDFADFAQGFAGVGKATSYEIEFGGGPVVLVAIASSEGNTVGNKDELYIKLDLAIAKYKDPTTTFLLRSYQKMAFNVRAKILVSVDMEFEAVKQDVEEALKAAFSFEKRDFGQAVTLSEVMSLIQGVEGVEAVDIESLYQHDPLSTSEPKEPEPIIPAIAVEQQDGVKIPSLLLINEQEIAVEEMPA
jgi:hypothetical protein